MILYHPEIVILDEAASSLDETTKQYVIHNLNSPVSYTHLHLLHHPFFLFYDKRPYGKL